MLLRVHNVTTKKTLTKFHYSNLNTALSLIQIKANMKFFPVAILIKLHLETYTGTGQWVVNYFTSFREEISSTEIDFQLRFECCFQGLVGGD